MLYIISAITLFLFLIPKINLVEVGSYNAGIRIDDLVLAIVCFFLVSSALINKKRLKISRLEQAFFIFIALTVTGTVINYFFWSRGSVLFPLRFLEYFIFFYLGRHYARSGGDIYKIFAAVFTVNALVSFLQLGGIIGGFTVRGFSTDVSERVVGVTSGPWELGVILNLVTCYFILNSKSQFNKYFVIIISTLIILLNGSRMSFVAQVVIMLLYFSSAGSLGSLFRRSILILPPALFALIFFDSSGVASRSDSLMSLDNIQALIYSYNEIQLYETIPSWDELGVLSGEGIDTSWSMRGTKWIYAIKLFLSSPFTILFGVGAGAFGNALDGGWLRIATECGLIGLTAFIAFFVLLKRINTTMKLMCSAFAVNMLMIDIYMAYKVMSFLLFCAGYYYATSLDRKASSSRLTPT